MVKWSVIHLHAFATGILSCVVFSRTTPSPLSVSLLCGVYIKKMGPEVKKGWWEKGVASVLVDLLKLPGLLRAKKND